MAEKRDLERRLGETWLIDFVSLDVGGEELITTISSARWRLRTRLGQTYDFEGDPVVTTDRPSGVTSIIIPPELQVSAGLRADKFLHEFQITTDDGQVSTQIEGVLTVRRGLFSAS